MGYNKEKVAYLRGVVDGMDLADDKYGKLFKLIVETLDEMADTVDENEEASIDMDECIDDIWTSATMTAKTAPTSATFATTTLLK